MNSNQEKVIIGVLCIQGGFSAHLDKLNQLQKENSNIEVVLIRKPEHLDGVNGLIIPGGESSVLSKHFCKENFLERLKEFVQDKKKFTWGTCAGMIVLSNNIHGEGKDQVKLIGGLDITCRRNYLGRQNESCEAAIQLIDPELIRYNNGNDNFNGIFIRPPGIESIDNSQVEVICKRGDEPIGVRQQNMMACSFHPELCNSGFNCSAWHQYFIQLVRQHMSK